MVYLRYMTDGPNLYAGLGKLLHTRPVMTLDYTLGHKTLGFPVLLYTNSSKNPIDDLVLSRYSILSTG